MSAAPPEVTVVIPTYNRSDKVTRALSSVLAQSSSSFEVIVVDDGSTDDTADVLAAIADSRVHVVRQQNQGLSAARNAGAAMARGRSVTFLDDDDQALPGWLDRFQAVFSDPSCGVVCCGRVVVDPEGATLRTETPMPLGPAYDDQVGSFAGGTFAVRRDLFKAVGGYTHGLMTNHGTELAFRLVPHCLAQGYEIRSIDEPGVTIEERPTAERAFRAAVVHYEGVSYLLEHHHDRIARSPRTHANYLSIAGVSAARLGNRREARRLFADAVRAEPRSPRRWARLVIVSLPILGARAWRVRADQPRDPAPGTDTHRPGGTDP